LAVLLQIVKRIEKQTGTTWAFTARQFAFSTQQFVNRVIYIDGSITSELFDLNLKDAHDSRYDPSSLTVGSIVEFIITSGVLISASTTSNYAITNPNTWPSGVFVRLIIESGAIVAGRGGDGGRGGKAFIDFPNPHAEYIYYYGGSLTLPSSHVHGKKGGNAILTNHNISINNLGVISVGGGGGGASGGAIARYVTSQGNTPGRCQSGSGAGGGWPFGLGGNAGQVIYDDSVQTDYTNSGDYHTHIHQVGNIGQTATKNIVVSVGGVGRNNYVHPDFYANTGNAGNGACPPLGVFSTGGSPATSTGEINHNFAGDGGNGGNNGDYAIHGNSFIIWENTGTIYGAIT